MKTAVERGALVALLVLWVALEAGGFGRRLPEAVDVATPRRVPASSLDLPSRYLLELAFGSDDSPGARLHRWTRPVDVKLLGAPTEDDRELVAAQLELLSELAGVPCRLTEGRPAIEIHLAAPAEFPAIEPNYRRGSLSFYWLWWSSAGELTRARILVARAGYLDTARRHRLIVESLARAMGLLYSGGRRPESVFYGAANWDVGTLAEIDREVLRRLYSPALRPGMDRATAGRALAAAFPVEAT